MNCVEGQHQMRAVNPVVHPTTGLELIGLPPQSKEEPAWCRICGALWAKRPFGLGWGFKHHLSHTEPPKAPHHLKNRRQR